MITDYTSRGALRRWPRLDAPPGGRPVAHRLRTLTRWAVAIIATPFVAWRDAVWAYALTEMGKVQAAERDPPTVEALIGELPAIAWPD